MLNSKVFFITFGITFLVTLIVTTKIIKVMTKKKIGQSILEIGPSWHKNKEGTPTMGGIAFLLSSLIAFVLIIVFFAKEFERDDAVVIINVLLYGILNGLVGVIDDVSKYRNKRNEGLTPKGKMAFQFILSALFLLSLGMRAGISTVIRVPFANVEFDMGAFYYIFAFLLLCGITNAVNLTDGLDGLASSCVLSVSTLFAVVGFLIFPNGVFSFFGGALMGICLAFLIFNLHPARIFMGDTGSLFFGSILVGVGVATNNSIALIIYSLVFLCEALSVILQVGYFKITHGKRIFKMAPIHHHFEKCGLSEMKIVSVFGAFSAVCCVVAYFCFV